MKPLLVFGPSRKHVTRIVEEAIEEGGLSPECWRFVHSVEDFSDLMYCPYVVIKGGSVDDETKVALALRGHYRWAPQ